MLTVRETVATLEPALAAEQAAMLYQDSVLAVRQTATLEPVVVAEQATILYQGLVLAVRPTANTGATMKPV